MDHERVAALHDGRLTPRERDELLTQVMSDADEYELFAETAAVLREIEEAHAAASPAGAGTSPADPPVPAADSADGVIPLAMHRPAEPLGGVEEESDAMRDREDGVIPLESRRRPHARRWMAYGALAAGLAGLALAATLLTDRGNGRLDDAERAVALLERGDEGGLPAGLEDPWLSTTRGDRGVRNIAHEKAVVQLGALLVDLELATPTNMPAVVSLTGRVRELLADTSMHGMALVASIYAEVNRRAAAGEGGIDTLLAKGREGVAGSMEPEWLELGIWAETARIAATRQDRGFFRSRPSRAALERIDALPLDEAGSAALRGVHAALPVEGRADWPALEEALTTLLRAAGR